MRWQGTARGAGWGKRKMPVCTRKKGKGEGRDISPLFYNQGVYGAAGWEGVWWVQEVCLWVRGGGGL